MITLGSVVDVYAGWFWKWGWMGGSVGMVGWWIEHDRFRARIVSGSKVEEGNERIEEYSRHGGWEWDDGTSDCAAYDVVNGDIQLRSYDRSVYEGDGQFDGDEWWDRYNILLDIMKYARDMKWWHVMMESRGTVCVRYYEISNISVANRFNWFRLIPSEIFVCVIIGQWYVLRKWRWYVITLL